MKNSLTHPSHPKFKDKKHKLTATVTEGTPIEVQKNAERHEFAHSIMMKVLGGIMLIFATVIFFIKNEQIENPVIESELIKISATQLSASIIFAVIGVIIIWIGSYKFTVKK